MKKDLLQKLIEAYKAAPKEFQATRYWDSKEQALIEAIQNLDPAELRSGKYPILWTFGFTETVFLPISRFASRVKTTLALIRKVLFRGRTYLPYSADASDIQEMALRHCELLAQVTGARPVSTIEASRFGKPEDLFTSGGKAYTMHFLGYYIRYCFAHKHIRFSGNETVVELGSGSGHQVELLKKLYPEMTILCFDLPPQIYLCELYLSNVLGKDQLVSSEETMHWTDLSKIQKGKVHFLGNWQMPLLSQIRFDLFWNAASFGEMEPDVVQNYLRYVKQQADWVYLLQIRNGNRAASVEQPILFEDYNRWLEGYSLAEEHDAYRAHKRMTENRGYFEAMWKRKSS